MASKTTPSNETTNTKLSSTKPSSFFTYEDMWRIPVVFYKTIGEELYEYRSNDKMKSFWYKVLFYYGFISFNLFVMGEFAFFFTALQTRATAMQAIAVAPCIGFSLCADFKQIALGHHKKTFQNLLDELEEIFPLTREKQIAYKLEYHQRNMKRVMVIFAMLCLAYTSTFSFYPMFKSFIMYYFLGAPKYERNFGFLIRYPFDATSNLWVYWTTYWTLAYAAYLAGVAFLCADLLLVATITQLCFHFDYIAEQLENYKVDPSKEKENIDFLRYIAAYHAKCLTMSEHVNGIFSFSLLLNFLTASLTICFTGFQVTTSTVEGIIQYCIFLLCSLLQVFMVCYYGDDLMTASQRVGDAAYNQEWFGYSTKYKKMLKVIIMRSQKPAAIHPPTFPPISFNTYMKVISMSYQFFALLRTTYTK